MSSNDANPFRRLMADSPGVPPLGSWLMSTSHVVAEAMGCAGFKWAVVDMEHAPFDLSNLVHVLQAVGNTPMVPVVRVPWNDTVNIKRVLDAGAQTLLIPFVQNAEEARRAVAATRYPPQGIRGMAGMSRATRFGTSPSYATRANDGISVILQLETPAAVKELEAIAAVPGVDALFLGPADLSASMGHVGAGTHPEVVAAMADAVRRCKAVRMPVGTVGGTNEVVAAYRATGYDFLAIASDLGLLMRAGQAAVAAYNSGGATVAAPAPPPSGGY